MDGDSRAAFWTFLGMAVAFKVITSVLIFAMMPSAHAALFLVGMNWYWLVPPILVLLLPALFWYRLTRVRAKRRELIRSEWLVDPELDWNPAATPGTMKKR
jgi:hypothetical protein